MAGPFFIIVGADAVIASLDQAAAICGPYKE
jgi:hypothetical protein